MMQGILKINILVVVAAMVVVAEYEGTEYLRSGASSYPYTFPCSGDIAVRLRRRNKEVFECGAYDECIEASYDLCNSIIDCHNFADELSERCGQVRQVGNETLPSLWQVTCDETRASVAAYPKPFNITQCDNGMCITECDICDRRRFIDCTDLSDEIGCNDDPANRPDPTRCHQYNQDSFNRKRR